MLISTVTTKGQATIPLAIRNKLGLVPGTKIQFLEDDCGVSIKALPSLESFMGALRGKTLPSEKELEKVYAQEAVSRYKKSFKG